MENRGWHSYKYSLISMVFLEIEDDGQVFFEALESLHAKAHLFKLSDEFKVIKPMNDIHLVTILCQSRITAV